MSTQIGFVLVRFLHDLFTAIWIGGLITLGVTILPAIKKQKEKGIQTKALLNTIQKRLNILVFASITGLWLTGMLLANRSIPFQGFLNISNTYSLALATKHVLVIVMTLLAVFRSLAIVQFKKLQGLTAEKIGAAIIVCNIILGVLVLFLSGYTAALSGLPTP